MPVVLLGHSPFVDGNEVGFPFPFTKATFGIPPLLDRPVCPSSAQSAQCAVLCCRSIGYFKWNIGARSIVSRDPTLPKEEGISSIQITAPRSFA